MTTVLVGQRPLEEALQPVPGVDGLWLLGTGERTSDPTGILGRPQLAEVLDQLDKMFDLVLVDSPPLLPVTDAAILAQAVDATLLVVAAGQTRARDVRRATEALSLVHVTTIGVVLNEVTRSPGSGYAYRYGYGKQYGYGEYPSTRAVADGNGVSSTSPAATIGSTGRTGSLSGGRDDRYAAEA
jgi:Mrp family chromosome partitioning ATPase